MGKTFAEKIFTKYAGRDVSAGEIVTVYPDVALSHDNTAAIIKTFYELGCTEMYNPEISVIVLDHCVPPANEEYAKNHKEIRSIVKKFGISKFYDINEGVCHQIMVEKGHVKPGIIAVGSDSHSTTYGCVGAFGVAIGRSEMAVVFATGKMWFRVPEAIKINLVGKFRNSFVDVKDLCLEILHSIGSDGATYKSVEFAGPSLKDLAISQRMTICNMAAEMGAKNAFIPPDEVTLEFLRLLGISNFEIIMPDEDAKYSSELTFDLSKIEPLVAAPHGVDNVKKVSEVKGIKIDEALLGTCTNGRLCDIEIAARIANGKKFHKEVRFLLLPASREVYIKALKKGYIEILCQAGAVILNPGCGPCLGAHEGVLAEGEVCISTANRNFKGRMGCPTASIYLANPAIVTLSALAGEITDSL